MTTSPETPAVEAEAVQDADFQHLAELATLVTSARDAMSDDIVTRLASAVSEGITLLDRLTRNEGLMHLLQALDRPENQDFLIGLSNAMTATSRDLADTAPAPTKGGIGGVLQLARDPAVQEGLKVLALFSQHLKKSMRDLSQQHGG